MPGTILAYVGPETLLPATSIIAALIGLLLTFWNYTGGAAIRWLRGRLSPRPAAPATELPVTSPASQPDKA